MSGRKHGKMRENNIEEKKKERIDKEGKRKNDIIEREGGKQKERREKKQKWRKK